jgi:hypothetical protein
VAISLKEASEAPYESGFTITSCKSSLGTPILSNSGANSEVKYSVAPEAKSIFTHTIKAHIEGRSEKADLTPPIAPFKKHAKSSFFEKRIIIATSPKMQGKI